MNNSKKPWRSSAKDIPREIIHDEILMRFPVKSLLKFRCVCKAWRDLIGNPRFIDSHLNHPSQKTRTDYLLLKRHVDSDGFTTLSFIGKDFQEDDDRVNFLEHGKIEIGGPCNGIILLGKTFILPDSKTNSPERFGDTSGSPIYLCNPATHELWKIPDRPFWCGYDCDWMTHSLGFGFDNCTNQYKIVSIQADNYRKTGASGFFTSIYYSGGNLWREAGCKIMPTVNVEGIVNPLNLNNAPDTNAGYILDGCGLYFDGILHWRMAIFNVDEEIILTFDLTTEEMMDISLPRGIEGASEGLMGLEDCLAFAVREKRTVPCSIEIWVMGEYGVQESWTKRFCINEEIPRFLACWNEDVLLFETREGELASCNLGKDVGQLKKHGFHGKIDIEKDNIHLGAIVMQKEGLVSIYEENR